MVGQIDSRYIQMRPTKFFSRMVSYAFFEGRPVTTRGQWINPLVLGIHSFAKRFPVTKKIEQPIFIMGTGRSGTTILGVVLSMHRDCGFLNEPKALWYSVFPFEDIIGSYTRGDAFYELDARHADADSIKDIRKTFGFYLSAVMSKRLVDKYPELIFRIEFLREIFPDFKGLFIYRNGWDTCISSANWSDVKGQTKNDELHDWWGVDNRKWNILIDQVVSKDDELSTNIGVIREMSNPVDKSVVEWIVSMKRGFAMAEKYPKNILPVRYESLVAQPENTLNEICSFCNLTKDAVMIKYGLNTLQAVPSKEPVEIHEVLKPVFQKWMAKLNYR